MGSWTTVTVGVGVMLLALILMIWLTCGDCRHEYLQEKDSNVDSNWKRNAKNDILVHKIKKRKQLQNMMITNNKIKAKNNDDLLKIRTADNKMKNRKALQERRNGEDYYLGRIIEILSFLVRG